MTFGEVGAKTKKFFAKIGKKNLIIIGAVALIGVAVCLNLALFSDDDDGYTYSGGNGMENELESTKSPTSDDSASEDTALDSYFSTIQVNRQRARDEALEVLNAVVENQDASDEVKAEAIAEIKQISLEMKQEADIESLVVTKGFDKCIAVISGESASIVVSCEGKLTPAQLAQINTIVYEQTGIEPINITITGKEI